MGRDNAHWEQRRNSLAGAATRKRGKAGVAGRFWVGRRHGLRRFVTAHPGFLDSDARKWPDMCRRSEQIASLVKRFYHTCDGERSEIADQVGNDGEEKGTTGLTQRWDEPEGRTGSAGNAFCLAVYQKRRHENGEKRASPAFGQECVAAKVRAVPVGELLDPRRALKICRAFLEKPANYCNFTSSKIF